MDKNEVLKILKSKKAIWRCTGPPEHWLTTIEKSVWGINRLENNYKQYKKLRPGDIIFFHATISNRLDFKNKSCIIGFGIVKKTYPKKGYFWLTEFEEEENIWPHILSFSDIFFFTDITKINKIPIEKKDVNQIKEEVNILTKNAILIKDINIKTSGKNFPTNGSISKILNENIHKYVINEIESKFISGIRKENNININETNPTDLIIVQAPKEIIVPQIKSRVAEKRKIPPTNNEINEEEFLKQYTKDERKLKKANWIHQRLVNTFIDFFEKKHFKPRENRNSFDLTLYNANKILLLEMKSKQEIRNSVAQLLFYEYFSIPNEDFYNNQKIIKGIVLTKKPKKKYLEWLKYLSILTFWSTKEDDIKGTEESIKFLQEFNP